ncbi:MAG TPA: hypothetical protein VN612_06275 [Acidobacteriaceae bacterium]|nr:hypothetical protein [Acidobacteriaceae bacterium]
MVKIAATICLALSICTQSRAQEADRGADLRATLSGESLTSSTLTQSPRYGSAGAAGFRAVFYPTLKFSDHWTVTGAWQAISHPYFYETFTMQSYGVKGYLLQASLNYTRVSDKGSLMVRAGQMTSTFGSFLLRYDDLTNPVAGMPVQYGYYGAVSAQGLAAAEIDATRGRFDGRLQIANSSPANPRSIFAHDQYGNWAGGGGYTIRQGFRLGMSAYRGPYLDRHFKYFFRGEANPNTLPAHAFGFDGQWARGHWNVQGEWQQFVMTYTAIPDFREQAGYGEVKRSLGPRWYAAARLGYSSANASGNAERLETAAGYRPGRNELLKVNYEYDHFSLGTHKANNTLAVQFVTTLHFSHAE